MESDENSASIAGGQKPSSKPKSPEKEEVAAAVSLLEFCANLEDYTPTVSVI